MFFNETTTKGCQILKDAKEFETLANPDVVPRIETKEVRTSIIHHDHRWRSWRLHRRDIQAVRFLRTLQSSLRSTRSTGDDYTREIGRIELARRHADVRPSFTIVPRKRKYP